MQITFTGYPTLPTDVIVSVDGCWSLPQIGLAQGFPRLLPKVNWELLSMKSLLHLSWLKHHPQVWHYRGGCQ